MAGKSTLNKEFSALDSEESDSDIDSEYEYNGGDSALYDSAADNVDEIKYLQQVFNGN